MYLNICQIYFISIIIFGLVTGKRRRVKGVTYPTTLPCQLCWRDCSSCASSGIPFALSESHYRFGDNSTYELQCTLFLKLESHYFMD